MRRGQNPAKFVTEVRQPERITVAVLSYIPFLSGYYQHTLDVLKLCLKSARTDAGLPFDLMVFDNGSCADTREFLHQEQSAGNIQYLLLSEQNVGKGGAWNAIFGGAPGEVIAYLDSDVLFSPGWLRRSVEILEGFPNVGMVTARPFRTPPEFYSTTLDWAKRAAQVESGAFIPWETYLEFNLSLGQTEAANRASYAATTDWRVSHNGLIALAGASHWQFVGYKSTLQRFLPFTMGKPMGEVRQLDRRMNDAGLLRLMVPEPLAMNMSNTPPSGGKQTAVAGGRGRRSRRWYLLNFPIVRKLLLGLYNRIFRWYYS